MNEEAQKAQAWTNLTDDERARVEHSNEVAGIVFDQVKRVWPDLHPVLDLRYGIADALWDAGFRRTVQGEPSLIECPHWSPGKITMRKGCTACAAVQGELTAHRFEGESDPIATNPILRGVDLALERLVRRDCFTERTLRILDELRAEVLTSATQEGENRD